MRSKKAFMRTMEAILAMGLTLIFVGLFIPQYNIAQANFKNENVLVGTLKDPEFRACVINENITCVNTTVSAMLEGYNVAVNISKKSQTPAQNLPEKRVYVESEMVAGNSTLYEPRILRIYYWPKE